MTREEQMLNGFAEMMKGFWNNQNLEVPNLESPHKQEPCSGTVSRQGAIDALWKALHEYEDKTEKQFQESEDLDVVDWIGHRIFVENMNDIDRQVILNLPSAQPEIIRCKDCIHRPIIDDPGAKDGFGLLFPDFRCPCRCDDGYYSWMPKDNWFCGNGEKEKGE